jgi:hypothetical protein
VAASGRSTRDEFLPGIYSIGADPPGPSTESASPICPIDEPEAALTTLLGVRGVVGDIGVLGLRPEGGYGADLRR